MQDKDTLDLAQRLIARRSVTPEDDGCLELIGGRLARLGFRLERIDSGAVKNLWARRGTAGPTLCFAGHTDVVPPGPPGDWHSDPFHPALREGRLYGRGAADMKSSLAAFVTATERFLAATPEPAGSIAFLLTSDEEGDAVDGTVRVVERLRERGERFDYCVVGEPTCVERLGDTIKNGRRGSLNGRLSVRGVQGHVAYPQLARNPVHLAAPALAELCALEWDGGDEYFPPTSFQISNLHAGAGVTNVIPGTLEVLFNFRFSPASPQEALVSRVHALLDRHRLDYRIDWSLSGNPFITPRGELVAAAEQAIAEVCGLSPTLSTSGGTSDGRFIAAICPQVLEFGPVNASIHKADEHIAAADLAPLSRVYQGMLERLIARERAGP